MTDTTVPGTGNTNGAGAFDEVELATLSALADVFVPSVRPPAGAPESSAAFWARRASDTTAPARVAAQLPELLTHEELTDLRRLLRVLRGAGIGRLPQSAAAGVLTALRADDDAREGLEGLRQLTMMAYYGGVEPDGTNPNWSQFGYAGPPPVTDTTPPLPLTHPQGDDPVITADVVVVGSGSGGGVVAATLAAGGLDVVVLEAGAPHAAQDFPGDEASALRRLYWRGGLVTTEDENVLLLAGNTLGGGSTVNWSNCVAPPEHVLAEWADLGLEGVDTPEFADHLAAVAQRMGVTDAHTNLNGENERLRDGAKALGWDWGLAARNVDPEAEDDRATGMTGFGDRAGGKQGGLLAWLPDAVASGARVVAGCRAHRVVTRDGRAVGVEATLTRPDGTRAPLLVRAPRVVLACGALETPALLLRSGIGGPAVGQHLRLHPVPIVPGVYDEPQNTWWGPPQGVVVHERSIVAEGHGYLLETPQWSPGLTGASIGWPSARDHKVIMGRFDHMATFLAVTRERGGGSVTLDEHGEGVVRYPLDDPFDRWLLAEAVRDLVRLHVAAGAAAVVDLVPGRDVWRPGRDVEAFADRLAAKPFGKDGRPLFSAHQMGTARIGSDPTTSVADADGQLHDTAGVWIGDTSAFPTAVGSNPMLTCMALAHRTAARILAED
jgi:choline dehydrogenase-like flavoprotein